MGARIDANHCGSDRAVDFGSTIVSARTKRASARRIEEMSSQASFGDALSTYFRI